MPSVRPLLQTALILIAATASALAIDDWQNLTPAVLASIPNYQEVEPQLYRRIGGIHVSPTTGAVIVVMNRDYGALRSLDHGASWQRLPGAGLTGRVYGGFSFCADPRSDRFAVFMQEGNPFKILAQGGLTLDGGTTWSPLTRPASVKKHDGFTWGGVDWSSPAPRIILGKEHHAWVTLWLSRDAGLTWEKLPFASRNPGVLNATTFVAGLDDISVSRGKLDLPKGIYRTTDSGQSWAKVSDFIPTGKTPVIWGSHAYWVAPEGVLVSTDLGTTWSVLGSPLPDSLYGPFFGTSEAQLLVVTKSGTFLTHNAGQTWTLVAAPLPGHHRTSDPTVSYGWDPLNHFLYYAPVGGDLFRLRLPQN
jgi:hypothetical protein